MHAERPRRSPELKKASENLSEAKDRLKLLAEAEEAIMEAKLKHELPHLFGYKPYRWTLEYWRCTRRLKFITAGNQLSKSSSQIRHLIDLMTDRNKWEEFFPKWVAENPSPPVAWYIYPNKSKILEEWEKWEREFLPRGEMRDDPVYGWKLEYDKEGTPQLIRWNSGALTWFKTWYQDLQAGTLALVCIDEEIKSDLWPEIAMRVTRYDGMISMVFTATLNQPFFFDVIERRGQPDERYPDAGKWQVSMEYDCRYYADGSLSPWTPDEVRKQKAKCGTDEEINRRIHGRFVSSVGRRFPSFSRDKNIKKRQPINLSWDFYAGVDIGASGDNHPAAISVIAVSPDYKKARLIRCWKGSEDEYTNTSQILNQYLEMTRDLPMTKAFYDYHSKEFLLRAREAGVPFDAADKSQDFGTDLLNVLFKNEMLDLDETDYVIDLATELENLRIDQPKRSAKDDMTDSLRYACSKVPFDFSHITGETLMFERKEEELKLPTIDEQRMGKVSPEEAARQEQAEWSFEDEISFYNDFLD